MRPATDQPAITARQLTKTYAAQTAVDRVDLSVPPGAVFGLLGLNGAGKTTLVRLLCGLLLPSSGAATVLGHDLVRDGARVRSLVGLASGEERSFSWRLSARRNLRFFAELHGLRGAAAAMRVNQVLDTLGLGAAADQLVGSFSSGMRQKLALARALLHQPPLLFLDEPTRALDLVAADELLALIAGQLVAQRGTTIVLTTHQLAEAERLCTLVAVIHGGQIRALGPPQQLIAALGLLTRYSITLAAAPPPLPEALVAASDLTLDRSGPQPALHFTDRSGALAAVLQSLAAAQVPVLAVSAAPPRLEDVLRHYIQDRRPGDADDRPD